MEIKNSFLRTFYVIILELVLIPAIIISQTGRSNYAKNGIVVSASAIASKVGVQILKDGGNAIDASVAVGFALAVTYPFAGNLGGGGFMVMHLENGTSTSIDFREKAPILAYREMYLDEKGEFNAELSQTGATSVGVPGSVAGLIYALKKYGTLPLSNVIQPAIDLARLGFILDQSDAASFKKTLLKFKKYKSSFKVFTKNGKVYKEGDVFKQPDLALTLEKINNDGKDGFYSGEVADLLVKQIQELGGYISKEDLKKYKPVEREPVIGTYRGHQIISMPPPSSGGIALVELLNILENFNYESSDRGSFWNFV